MTRPKTKIFVEAASPRARISKRLTTSPNIRLPVNRFITRGVTCSKGGKRFDIQHELTPKGIVKFPADDRATVSRPE